MSKELTEKCKQRKLPDGLYWVKHNGVINILDNYEAHLTEVEEVLAPVQSYDGYTTSIRAYNDVVDENTKLKQLLEIIKKYLSLIKRNVSVGSLAYTYVENAKTEIEELEK